MNYEEKDNMKEKKTNAEIANELIEVVKEKFSDNFNEVYNSALERAKNALAHYAGKRNKDDVLCDLLIVELRRVLKQQANQ